MLRDYKRDLEAAKVKLARLTKQFMQLAVKIEKTEKDIKSLQLLVELKHGRGD